MNLLLCSSLLIIVSSSWVSGDMLRKSIVFDKATPDVFYCPVHKPITFEKMFVRSRPLHKLCEFNGQRMPADYKSDCYNDVDESDYACKEKKRIMMRLDDAETEAFLETSRKAATRHENYL